MARAKIVNDGDGKFYGIRYNCPGCALMDSDDGPTVLPVLWLPPGAVESPHVAGKPHWGFNGDFQNPTFTPSVLTRTGHYMHEGEKPGNCACDFQQRYPDEEPWDWPCGKCHSFVKNGKVEFLSDCTHSLAGQTVELPELAEG